MQPVTADQRLIQQIRQGVEGAWHALIARYQGRLLAFARSRLGSTPDAEDVVQETFIGLLQSLDRFDISRSLETYLFAILRNKILDTLKKRGTSPIRLTDDGSLLDDMLPAAVTHTAGSVGRESPSGYAMLDERRLQQADRLADALRSLIHTFREKGKWDDLRVIELSFYMGRRNKDIADLLGLDEKQVAGIKFRAIRRLREWLSEGAAEPEEPPLSDVSVARVWRWQRLTCLKRSTLGALLLGVLEEPWASYTRFHLDVVACPLCRANLEDLQAEVAGQSHADLTQRLFTSSVGFLSGRRSGYGPPPSGAEAPSRESPET